MNRSYFTGLCRDMLMVVGMRRLLSKISEHACVHVLLLVNPPGSRQLGRKVCCTFLQQPACTYFLANGHQSYSASLPTTSTESPSFPQAQALWLHFPLHPSLHPHIQPSRSHPATLFLLKTSSPSWGWAGTEVPQFLPLSRPVKSLIRVLQPSRAFLLILWK